MATVEYLQICDYAFLAEGGKPSLIGLFEFINAPAVPFVYPQFSVAAQIHGAAHERIPVTVSIGVPGQEPVSVAKGEAVIADGKHGIFVVINFANVRFVQAEQHAVAFTAGNSTEHRFIDIRIPPATTGL